MREILFRGKRVDNGEWVYGGHFKTDGEHYIITNSDGKGIFDLWDMAEFVISETVGQYTGLTDKSGKKIFEGDIIGYEWHSDIRYDWDKYYGKYVVEGIVRYGNFNCSCCDGVFGWYIDGGDIRGLGDYTHLEVIANIHDNPELLGGQDNE